MAQGVRQDTCLRQGVGECLWVHDHGCAKPVTLPDFLACGGGCADVTCRDCGSIIELKTSVADAVVLEVFLCQVVAGEYNTTTKP